LKNNLFLDQQKSRYEILKTIGNSTHNFYKKCDTNKEQKQHPAPSPITLYV